MIDKKQELIDAVMWYARDNELITGMDGFSRKMEHKLIRFYLFTMLRNQIRLPYQKIGLIFGQDHATVINGLKKWLIYENDEDVQYYTEDVRALFPLKTNEIKHYADTKEEKIRLQQIENQQKIDDAIETCMKLMRTLRSLKQEL